MRVDLAKKAFKDLYANKGLHWCNDHFDWFVKTYSNLLASEVDKQNPEAWREANRKKQSAGVRFEVRLEDGRWHQTWCDFDCDKEDYREVPQEVSGAEYARAEIVDLLSLILRTHSRDELFALFRSAEGITPKEDPEAWREENRKKQAAGVKFEKLWYDGKWHTGVCSFTGNKEDYREVPQDVSASECQKKALEHLAKTYSADKGTAQLNPTIPPHAAERALWKAQREAGTNEVWQWKYLDSWRGVEGEPRWSPDIEYSVKPMKLTARICRNGNMTFWQFGDRVQDWEFFGTREEYRAECEKYGYVVISEIKEVIEKPKTVKYYFAMFLAPDGKPLLLSNKYKSSLLERARKYSYTIVGAVEEREVEI